MFAGIKSLRLGMNSFRPEALCLRLRRLGLSLLDSGKNSFVKIGIDVFRPKLIRVGLELVHMHRMQFV